jgi:5-carboxymethyl-2-hydroxymuconate isomerase
VGKPDQSDSSFLHITLKVLAGRSPEIRKNLAEKIATFAKTFFIGLNLPTNRCDVSVDIVEMDATTYQKIRIENSSKS